MLVVNAGNRAKDWRLLTKVRGERGFACELTDASDDIGSSRCRGRRRSVCFAR